MIKSIPLYRLELVRERSIPYQSVDKTEQCAEVLHELLDRSPVEQLVVMYVDPMLHLAGIEKVGLGSLTHVNVSTTDIFRGAIAAAVPYIMLGHNHPTDDPTPSHQDWSLTDRVTRLGMELGITLLDHIIVTPTGKHVSMKDEDNKYNNQLYGLLEKAINKLPYDKQGELKNKFKNLGLVAPREITNKFLTLNDLLPPTELGY